MISKKKISPQEKYDKANTTRYQLKLNNQTDADIIQKLSTVKSKQGYIKECIRKDLENMPLCVQEVNKRREK